MLGLVLCLGIYFVLFYNIGILYIIVNIIVILGSWFFL